MFNAAKWIPIVFLGTTGCPSTPTLPPRADVPVVDMDVEISADQPDAAQDVRPGDVIDVTDVADADAADADVPVFDASITVPAPRPLAPLSGSVVTSRRPNFRWQLERGLDGGQVELCADPACSSVIAVLTAPAGETATPPSDLAARAVVFWRLRGIAGRTISAEPGPVWQFTVPTVAAPSGSVNTVSGSSLDDVNGDGFADTIVGAPRQGRVFVYLGTASGPVATAFRSYSAPSGTETWFGNALALGDLNGDGYADLVVGGANEDSRNQAVYIYYGSAAGLPTAASATIPVPTPVGEQEGFGTALLIADLNGDGIGDLIATEPGGGPRLPASVCDGLPSATSGPGITHIFSGRRGGNPSLIQSIESQQRGCYSSGSCVVASDFNGDGRVDLAVCNSRTGGYTHLFGGVEVYLNSATGLPSLPSTSVQGTRDHGGLSLGADAVGDVNGDGYGDLVVGEPGWDSRWDYNLAHVFFGSAAGIRPASTTLHGPSGSGFGYHIENTGDANGDGFNDFAVSAPSLQSGNGAVYFYPGGTSGPSDDTGIALPSRDGNAFGSTMGASDIDGDGRCDLAIVGAGRVYLYRGAASIATTPTWQIQNSTADSFGACIE